MKIKNLFDGFIVGTIVHSPVSNIINLFRGKIINIDLSDDIVILTLKEDNDSKEAESKLFIKEEYKDKKEEIFNWLSDNKKIFIGKNIIELEELDVEL